MKKSDLIRVVREVVKKEVARAVKKEVRKVINPKKADSIPEFSKVMEHAEELFNKKPAKKFAKDPMLNAVLNETANDWPTLANKTLDSTDAWAGRAGLASTMGMQSPDEMFGGKPSLEQMLPEDKKRVEVPEAIEKALTRDYSDLMKAMDKKQHK